MWNTQEQAGAYVAALIDGEGHICNRPRDRKIMINNCDLDILRACASACDLLEVTYTLRIERYLPSGPFYLLLICGEINFRLILDRVPIQCARKKKVLEEGIASFSRKMKQSETRVLV